MKRTALLRRFVPYFLREPEEVPVRVLDEELLDPVEGVSTPIPVLLQGAEEGDTFFLERFDERIHIIRMKLEVDAPPVWVLEFTRCPAPVRLLNHKLRAFAAKVHEVVCRALIFHLEPECVDVEGSAA